MNFRPIPCLLRARRAAFVAALLGALAIPAAATAEPTAGTLSPRLAELATPAVRSLPPARQAQRLSLTASGPGSLLRRGDRVLVDVRFERGAAASVDALRRAGAQIVHVSSRYQVVTVAATPASLPRIGELARVRGVAEDLTPISRATCPSGSVVSEGDTQLDAANARADFGVDGTGVTVGILSDSFDQDQTTATSAAGDVASGDLPGSGSPCGFTTPVGILENSDKQGEDEGRGMAQIVHDLAPGAAIDFASAFNGEFSFADNIRALYRAGARVIADDVAYPDEPFFQDGPVAVAVDEVTAGGASYFTAAGNDNLIDESGRDIASWEAPAFRDEGSCPAGVPPYAEDCMNFDPGAGSDPTFGITVKPGDELFVDLQWAQPWEGVSTDLDAYLLKGGVKVAESEFPSTDPSVQEPVELIGWSNPSKTESATVKLVINRCAEMCGEARALAHPKALEGTSGGDTESPRLKIALLQNGGGVSETEYPESEGEDTVGPTIFGHAGAESAFTLGAIRYNTATEPEYFSSRGPVTHYFGPVVGTEPAPELSQPEFVAKPDAVASDCVSTTFFATPVPGGWRFCGTSAAAPHAAAIAALVRQGNPGATVGQVRSALSATARPIAGFGPDAVGAGMLDAFPAVDSLALPPTVRITKAPAALSRDSRPTIEFSANRPVDFSCSLDALPAQPCGSPYIVPAKLSDGRHAFSVSGTDLSGRAGNSGVASFTIDTKAPRTTIVKHPPKLLVTHRLKAKAVFRFRSSESGGNFVCKVDRELLRPCGRRLALRLPAGRHAVRVRARDQAGNFDATPAVFRFRVKRVG